MTWRLLYQMYPYIRIHSQIQNHKSKIDNYVLTGKFSTDVLWNLGSLALLGASGVLINTIIAHYQSPASLGLRGDLVYTVCFS